MAIVLLALAVLAALYLAFGRHAHHIREPVKPIPSARVATGTVNSDNP